MRNRVFFPQAALDAWLAEERIELRRDELTIKGEGRRYRLIEAIRVLREVAGVPDVYEILGKVKTRAYLTELGAELLGDSMVLGDSAYDVVPGFVGAPIGLLGAGRGSPEAAGPSTDEELLRAFLARRIGG